MNNLTEEQKAQLAVAKEEWIELYGPGIADQFEEETIRELRVLPDWR